MVIYVKYILIVINVYKKVGNWRYVLFINDWRDVFSIIVLNVLSINKFLLNLLFGCVFMLGIFLFFLYIKIKVELRVLLIGYLNKNID